MRNNLIVNRLRIVTLYGEIAYDESFHRGVNIICGENSSGKSTISHFLFYVLGGAFNNWVKEAKQCKEVFAEIELNGACLTLRREVTDHTKSPIYFLWEPLESYLLDPYNKVWDKFGYDMTSERKSFSNVLFENLDLPLVHGDNNITMHQILRLLYVDQDSPTNSLFLYEQFDSQLNRMTIADLLLGVYDESLYHDKLDQRAKQKEHEKIIGEINGVKKFVGNLSSLSSSMIKVQIENKEKEIEVTELKIIALKDEKRRVNYTTKTKLDFERLNDASIKQREKIKELEDKQSFYKYDIEDTIEFVHSLRNKQTAIKNSIVTRDFLGEFQLDHCPECLSKIDGYYKEGTCKLCKNEIDQSYGITQARKIEQELDFQIKESTRNISKKQTLLQDLEITLESERLKLNHIQKKVNSAIKSVKSIREEKIDQLYIDKGYFEGELIQLRTLLESAEAYENLREKKHDLEIYLAQLKKSIEIRESNQERLKKDIKEHVQNCGLSLLRNDLYRQKEFKNAKSFTIDYRNNLAFIDDKELRFSASSDFYLKTTARYSIFFASLEVDSMRYPRFILCDNMEDKGIEQQRAQNFQKLLVEKALSYTNVDFQMIYTTSFITEELKNSEYIVGEFYTKSNPSLKGVN